MKEQIKTLLEYLYMGKEIKKADIILGLGSIDYKVAEKCAELYKKGYGKYIIFTGKCGKGTEGIITQTEAENFRDIAIKQGVPEEKIFLEKCATNTYENYIYSSVVMEKNNLNAKSIIVVQKPYAEKRSYLIAEKIYNKKEIYITSPEFSIENYEEYYNSNKNTNIFEINNEIVAEINLIEKVSKYNLQMYQKIPEKIKVAYN